MHVPQWNLVPLPPGVRTVGEVTDEAVERGKAAHRGLILDELLELQRDCRAEGSADPRYLELRVRIADRLIRLLKLEEPAKDAESVSGDGDRRALVERAAQTLNELEARRQG